MENFKGIFIKFLQIGSQKCTYLGNSFLWARFRKHFDCGIKKWMFFLTLILLKITPAEIILDLIN